MATTQTSVVPRHLGIILDGNRRWAREHGLSIYEGHRQGYLSLKRICKAALKQGIEYVSAYVFSTENWKRDPEEVKDIMKILKWVLRHEVEEFHGQGIRLRVIGSKSRLAVSLVQAIQQAEERTKDNIKGTLTLCLNYGGQQEIVDALKKIVSLGIKSEDITTEVVAEHLYAPEVPPLDMVIRTSGEQRLSNFMLWEAAYSELLFVPMYWPDFGESDLKNAVNIYALRQRRFGN